jgi:hypothetical protein
MNFQRRAVILIGGILFGLFGIVSAAQAASITVTNLNGDNSAGSLGAAMAQANSNPSDRDVITFQPGTTGTIGLSNDLPVLTGPVEITGPGSDKLTIAGTYLNTFRMFKTDGDLQLSGLHLTKGNSNTSGGAVASTSADLVLKDVLIDQSRSYTGEGGAVYVNGGTLDVENSHVIDNLAAVGGGISVHGATSASISNTQITGNDAHYFFDPGPDPETNRGGGLMVEDTGSLTIDESVINGNASDTDGAAFFIDQVGDVAITDTSVANNSSDFIAAPVGVPFWGTARIVADETTITGSQFSGNFTSTLSGIQVVGPVTISDSVISGNQSGGYACGLTLGEFDGTPSTVTATVSNTTISGNSGGSLAVGLNSSVKKLKLESSTISGNNVIFPVYPTANAAGLVQMTGTATLTNTIISGNFPADISAVGKLAGSPQPNLDYGGYVEGSYNLIGKTTGRPFKDLVKGSNITSNDPKLGDLAYVGDAPTPTMLPADNSPVIDQGLSSLAKDQIGNKRTVDQWDTPNAKGGNGTDIGAVELSSFGPPPSKFSFGKLKPNKKKGTATLQVKVPAAGKVDLLGSKTVKATKKTIADKGTVVLTVQAKGKALKQLKTKGKTKLKVKVKYSPTGGTSKTQSESVRLIKK